jgi:hypothetical protein
VFIRAIRKLFSKRASIPPAPPESHPTPDLTSRRRRAAETILQNERLTEGLDDATAQDLLDWGLALADRAVQSTAALDDTAATQELELRLQAVQRLMRRLRYWLANGADIDDQRAAELLSDIIQQTTLIYDDYVPPDTAQRAQFLGAWHSYSQQPRELIAELKDMLNASPVAGVQTGVSSIIPDPEEENDP